MEGIPGHIEPAVAWTRLQPPDHPLPLDGTAVGQAQVGDRPLGPSPFDGCESLHAPVKQRFEQPVDGDPDFSTPHLVNKASSVAIGQAVAIGVSARRVV